MVFKVIIIVPLYMQESLLKYGKALACRNGELKWKEVMIQLGQAGLTLGVLAAAAFTIKHVFV